VGEGVANRIFLQLGAAKFHHVTTSQHDPQRADVLARRPIFVRSRPGRVTGNGSPNRRLLFAGWVGSKEKPGASGGAFYLPDESARTYSDRSCRSVDLTDSIQSAEGEQQALVGDRSGGSARLTPGTRDRRSISSGALYQLDNILDTIGPSDQIGQEVDA
jgi:hypothetical protein